MKAIMKAFVVSGMCGAVRKPVVGLDGVSVSYDESQVAPRRLYLTFPNGKTQTYELQGETLEACARNAADIVGLPA